MGLFNLFKKKSVSEEERRNFVNGIYDKYFDGSYDKLHEDASELLEVTKFNLTLEEMSGMLIRCLGFRELKEGWCDMTRDTLRRDCSEKLTDVELQWLLVYSDVHYIKHDSGLELEILMEQAGRQMGMPSPLGDISASYQFE